MKSLKQGLLIAAVVLSQPTWSCTEDGTEGFVPENNMKISVNAKRFGGLTEAQFNNAIERVEVLYAPIVAQLGGKLVIDRAWDDATVNAYAQRSGSNWMVNMFGGLARHEAITEDGMSLVVCHEIGHHIGGAPKNGAKLWPRGTPRIMSAARSSRCLRRGRSCGLATGARRFTSTPRLPPGWRD